MCRGVRYFTLNYELQFSTTSFLQHFPQPVPRPPLENVLPHLHAVTFPNAPESRKDPIRVPESAGPEAASSAQPLSDSMVSISAEELKELRKLQAKADEEWSEDEIMEEAAKASLFTAARDDEIRARASHFQGDLDAPSSSSMEISGGVPPPLGSSSSYSTASGPSQDAPSSSVDIETESQESLSGPLTSSSSSGPSRPPSERWVVFDPVLNSFSNSRSERKKPSKPPAKKPPKTEPKKSKADTKSKSKAAEAARKDDKQTQ